MTKHINRQWRLARRPVASVKESDFEWCEDTVRPPGPGELLVRNRYLSVDPFNRAFMWQEDTFLRAQPLGSVIRGITVGTVEKSNNRSFAEGTPVLGLLGWQDYAVTDCISDFMIPLTTDGDFSLPLHLGLLGHVGITAYFGLLDVGKPRTGETLVVSSAAGAVGSLVGQIGKLYGCHVVGIAGTEAKCRWIREDLGFDGAINYRSESLFKRLRALCPRGIDIYFDKVGGAMLEDVLSLLNVRARTVICGMLSLYNDVGGTLNFPGGPNNLFNLMTKRARMEGFLCTDYFGRAAEAIGQLTAWHRAGKIRYRVSVVDGLRNAPRALNQVFEGTHAGKLAVRI